MVEETISSNINRNTRIREASEKDREIFRPQASQPKKCGFEILEMVLWIFPTIWRKTHLFNPIWVANLQDCVLGAASEEANVTEQVQIHKRVNQWLKKSCDIPMVLLLFPTKIRGKNVGTPSVGRGPPPIRVRRGLEIVRLGNGHKISTNAIRRLRLSHWSFSRRRLIWARFSIFTSQTQCVKAEW